MHVRDSQADRRPRRGAPVLLGLIVLLAVVALASSGHVSSGASGVRRPGAELADTLLSLLLVVLLIGGVGIFYVYNLQRAKERRVGGRPALRGVLVFVITLVLLATALAVRAKIHNRKNHAANGLARALPAGRGGERDHGYTPHFAPLPVAVVLGAAGIAAIAAYLSHRARRKTLGPLALGPASGLTLAHVLGGTLDDLRAEPDPRIAVIAAYARLERTLAAFGMPRRESDAPLEYLRRILLELDVSAAPVSRLTHLFEEAKFSTRDVGPDTKAEAIELLEAIRAGLHAAEAARSSAVAAPPVEAQPA